MEDALDTRVGVGGSTLHQGVLFLVAMHPSWELELVRHRRKISGAERPVLEVALNDVGEPQSLRLFEVTTDHHSEPEVLQEVTFEGLEGLGRDALDSLELLLSRDRVPQEDVPSLRHPVVGLIHQTVFLEPYQLLQLVFEEVHVHWESLQPLEKLRHKVLQLILRVVELDVKCYVVAVHCTGREKATLFGCVRFLSEILRQQGGPNACVSMHLRRKREKAVSCHYSDVDVDFGLIEAVVLFEPNFEMLLVSKLNNFWNWCFLTLLGLFALNILVLRNVLV